jgi:hypothetical protein
MPRSNSSLGVADGGSVVSAPVALGLRGGGNAPGGFPAPPVLARSSGSPAPRPPGRLLNDRRRSGNLLVVTRLWLPIGRTRLHRRCRSDAGLGNRGLTAGGALRAALKHSQAIFQLPVAVLQLLVLAGELPQLILKLLDPHFGIAIIGLCPGL